MKWFYVKNQIVKAAQRALSNRLNGSNYVSGNTKNAQAIAKTWRSAVNDLDPDWLQVKVMVSPEFEQRIGVVDFKTGCA